MTEAGVARLGMVVAALACLAAMAACAPGQDPQQASRGLSASVQDVPTADADPQGGCWGVDAALHGAGVLREPVEIPCPELVDRNFVNALQRALAVRGYHEGRITGEMDPHTRAAVRAFQAGTGFDSDVLTLANARRLGLVVYASGDL